MGLPPLNVLSLFSGIGGLDLGLRRAVPLARTVCYVEREAYAIAVLVARIQEGRLDAAPIHSDVSTFDGRPWRGLVDCVIGGFPCQDISNAGKRAGFVDATGKATRSGLWFQYARILDEVRPRFVFIENVAALVRRGLDIVLGDLASLGFDAEWGVYSAAEAGAPHRRERLFLLAWRRMGHTDGERECESHDSTSSKRDGRERSRRNLGGPSELLAYTDGQPDERRGSASHEAGASGASQGEGDQRQRSRDASDDREQTLADADADGPQIQRLGLRGLDKGERSSLGHDVDGCGGTEAALGDYDDAGLERRDGQHDSGERVPWPPGPSDAAGWGEYLARWPSLEPSICRGSDGAPDRVDRLRALGNAVCPDQAALAFRDLADRAAISTKFLRGSE